jgi:hypothetical protein
MSLRSFAGVAVALALLSTPALACKGRNTAFSDDFSREEPSWTTIFGEFGVTGGKATLKSNPGEIAVVANDGDFFESGDLCVDVIAPDYRGGGSEFGGVIFAIKDMGNFHAFWISPPDGLAGVTARKAGKWVNPVSGRKSDAINQRSGAVNQVRLTWKDKTVSTYINDKPFVQFTVQPLPNAYFGLYAQTEGKVWQFDNYKITD